MPRLSTLTVAALAAVSLAACQKSSLLVNAAPAANVAAAPAADNAAPVETNSAPANAVPTNSASASPASDGPGVASPDADAIRAFLAGLYAHYKSSDSKFDLFGRDAAATFDADTRSLMKAEGKALKGEVGSANDSDPLCMCQDFEKLQARITVQSASAAAAKASAEITDTGLVDGATPRRVDFDLTRTAAGWRIHDIHSKDEPSFRGDLAQDIKDAKTDK